MRRRTAIHLLALLLALRAAPLTAAEATAERLDGGALRGRIAALGPDHLRLVASSAAPGELAETRLAYHELRALRFASSALASPQTENGPPSPRACLIFRGGELLAAKLLAVEDGRARALVRGAASAAAPSGDALGEIAVPLSALRGARLREEHAEDSLFEEALTGPAPAADVVYVRREGRLVPVEGVLRRLDDEDLTLEYRGRERQIKRNLVYGIQLAPVGEAGAASGYEGLVCLRGGGKLPAAPMGLLEETGKAPRLRLSVRGLEWQVELAQVEAIIFANERIVFLSDLAPAAVRETALLGAPFPHRRDQAVDGGPLRLAGVEYRKGLGTHARTALEYTLEGGYESFAARLGMDDAVRGIAAEATAAVLADGRRIFETVLRAGDAPLDLALPVAGTRTLRLEVDFGADGLDSGDHVDWAEARLVKAPRPGEGKPR